MKFTPNSAQRQNAQGVELGDHPSDLTDPNLYVSGSHWDEKHLRALRVISFDNSPPSVLIPKKWVPHHYRKFIKDLRVAIQAPSREDLRHWDQAVKEYDNNPFKRVFDHLSAIMVKPQNKSEHPAQQEGAPTNFNPETGESESSEEDEVEESSRQAIQELAYVLAGALSDPESEFKMRVNVSSMPVELRLGPEESHPHPKKAKNDGGLILTHGDVQGKTPLVSFESKRRRVEGQNQPTGQPEAYNPKTAAQEVAEMLGQALAEYRAGGSERDEMSYVVTIHGTRLRVAGAYFTKRYLDLVQSPHMPTDEHLYVRRSEFYELKDQGGRAAALKLLVGLFRYVMSGTAPMEQTREVAAQLGEHYGKH